MRSPTSAHRPGTLAALAAVGWLAACGIDRTASNPACSASANNLRFELNRTRVGKMLTFQIDPTSLIYHYIDVRSGDTTQYDWTWNPNRGYYGTACLRFSTTDSLHIDSTGTFQFFMSGTNSGYMDRRVVGPGVSITDSVVGNVFYGCEGDGGTYRLNADSSITYTWANGDLHWMFNPSALHKLRADTIASSFAQSAYADSVRSSMRFNWVRNSCGSF